MKKRPILIIAGLDPTGGAGVAIDIRVAAAYERPCAVAITACALQTHSRGFTVESTQTDCFTDMLTCALAAHPEAVKIGMLASEPIAEITAEALSQYPELPVVLDTVFTSTSGLNLIDKRGKAVVRKKLLPAATLITPNWGEAGELAGLKITTQSEAAEAGKSLFEQAGTPVLVTGGHSDGIPVDILVDSEGIVELPSERVRGEFRGTGCALSSMIAAELADGLPLRRAVLSARAFLAASMANSAPPYINIGRR